MTLTSTINDILTRFEDNNFEAYLVGGCVRDYLLNKPIHDFDITTSASINEIIELFKDAKIIETGLKHGTVTIHLNHYSFEITIFKGATLKEDLLNRDITINALAMDKYGKIYDYTNGQKDLNSKIIRITHEAAFDEDPLRILRCIRFASCYNFEIEDYTKKLMLFKKNLINNVSIERINSEFSKVLISDSAYKYLDAYKEIIFEFIKELEPLVKFEQHNHYHIYDVWNHTLKVVENVSNNLVLRLSALLHDVGKPKCFTIDEKGIGHFYNHATVSKEIALTVLKRMKYDNDTIERCANLIFYHDAYLNYNKKDMKKMLNKIGEKDIFLLYNLKKADVLGQNPQYLERLKTIDNYVSITNQILETKDCFSKKDLAINGHDLVKEGYGGKQIKDTLELVLQKVINEELINEKEVILNYLKSIK